MEEFLGIVRRFQRRQKDVMLVDAAGQEEKSNIQAHPQNQRRYNTESVAGRKRLWLSQTGIPEQFVQKIKDRVAKEFLELTLSIF